MMYCEYDCAAFDRWLWNKFVYQKHLEGNIFNPMEEIFYISILRSIQTSIVAAQAYFNWNEGRKLAKHNKKKRTILLGSQSFRNKNFFTILIHEIKFGMIPSKIIVKGIFLFFVFHCAFIHCVFIVFDDSQKYSEEAF